MFEIEYENYAKKFSEAFPEMNKSCEIRNFQIIIKILNIAIPEFGLCLAVDFFDSSNFDHIEKLEFDSDRHIITIIWYETKPKYEENSKKLIYYGHRSKLDIQISSIFIDFFKRIPLLSLRGYYLNKKEANQYYTHGASEVKISRDGNMTMDIYRLHKKFEESITVPILNLYSIAIIPKTIVDPRLSKRMLVSANVKMITSEFSIIQEKISNINEEEIEDIESIGNRARKNMERALKFIAIVEGLNVVDIENANIELQGKMLGELKKLILPKIANSNVEASLNKAIFLLNLCSHDHGQYIKKDDIINGILNASLVIDYIFKR